MRRGRHARRRGERHETDRIDRAGDEDFAEEHTSTTFADEMRGGPEGTPEPETPTGEAGDGGMDPRSSK